MRFTALFTLVYVVTGNEKKPNIVFLLIDDLGYNDVSWHNKEVIMPNLQSLANKATHLKTTDFSKKLLYYLPGHFYQF